jgi:hypothetical protein
LHERSGFQFLMGPRQGTGLNAHRGFHPAPLDQGVWHHVAVCWDTPPERGWVSLIYANGKAGEPSQPGGFRLARFAEMEEKEPPKWRPLNVTPQNPLRLTGAFDAVFDEIRVSDVVRYPTDFQPVKAPLAADDHTLLLLRLDGDASGIGRGGVAVNAAFRE